MFKNSFGIAVWVPNKTQYDQRKNMYKGLNFSKASLWDEFLDALTTAGVQAPKPTQGQR